MEIESKYGTANKIDEVVEESVNSSEVDPALEAQQ